MSKDEATLARILEVIYVRVTAAADWCVAHMRLVLLVGVPLMTIAIAAIGQVILQDFPNSGDEYAYVYQAATFAEGRLWNVAFPVADAFSLAYVVADGEREYSSFPLGWPLMLAMAVAAQVPIWLVNPLLGTTTLLLVAYLGTRLHDARVGVAAAGLVAVSGFFLFNAASYFSHVFCSVLLLAAACLAVSPRRLAWWVPLAIGFLFGWAVLARYYTAVICAIPIVLLLCRQGAPVVRTLVLIALGGVPWIVVLGAYNLALNGSPWQLTTLDTTMGLWFAPKFAQRGADILSTQMLRFVLWTPPLLLFVYIFYLARGDRALRRGAIDWMPVIMAAALYCYIERGGNQYGPRFYYETFPFLAIFTAAHLFRERTFLDKAPRDRRAFALVAASVVVMPISFMVHGIIEQRVISERLGVYKAVAAAGLTQAVVLIRGRVGTQRSIGPLDLTRNGIAHDGGVLYGLDIDDVANCRLASVYPERPLYLYEWDRAARDGTLSRIACGEPAR